jgi:hypothetical protein
MSVHPLPNVALVNVPAAETLAGLRKRIRNRPNYLNGREDGVYQAAVFLQTLEDHGPALSSEQAGEIYRDMVLDEIARLPMPADSILTDDSLRALARFSGFFEAMGGFLFDTWKDRHGQRGPA